MVTFVLRLVRGDRGPTRLGCGPSGQMAIWLKTWPMWSANSFAIRRTHFNSAANGERTGTEVSEGLFSEILVRLAEAAIPVPTGTEPPGLGLARNEIAEVLALSALEEIHGYVVPASRIKHKEAGSQPSRGVDVLALDSESRVVICEVKLSTSHSSPPSVISTGALSMHGEMTKRLGSPNAILAELVWAMKHSSEPKQILVLKAMLRRIEQPSSIPIRASACSPSTATGHDPSPRRMRSQAGASPARRERAWRPCPRQFDSRRTRRPSRLVSVVLCTWRATATSPVVRPRRQ